jgi:transcriptional regulator with XRE-family HTH domain
MSISTQESGDVPHERRLAQRTSPDAAENDDTSTNREIAVWIGRRLRALRGQRQMSLVEIEQLSGGAFGPSTVGAYERGDRTISLPRLERLADLYDVPVSHFVPHVADAAFGSRPSPIAERLSIDLIALQQLSGDGFVSLLRFIELVRQQRSDVNPHVVTLRGSDSVVVAAMLAIPLDTVVDRLRALGLLTPSTRDAS